MTGKITRPALKYHGGKFKIASWILGHFPEHRCYVEPFGGAGSILLKKKRSYIEVYNDMDSYVANFFAVLRDPVSCEILKEQCVLTPYSREEFKKAAAYNGDYIEMARCLIVRASMGFGGFGAIKESAGFRLDTSPNTSFAARLWGSMPESISAVGERLRDVLIENRDGLACMRDHDREDTLHFVDPPYVMSTRKGKAYRCELTNEQHIKLLGGVRELKGMVIICGYNNDIYNDMLSDWKKEERMVSAQGRCGAVRRKECLWINGAAADAKC